MACLLLLFQSQLLIEIGDDFFDINGEAGEVRERSIVSFP